jgi:hypothetical protein
VLDMVMVIPQVDAETFRVFAEQHCNSKKGPQGVTEEKLRLFFKNLRWIHTNKFLLAKRKGEGPTRPRDDNGPP